MSWTHNSTTYRRAALYKRAARFLLLVLKVARTASICIRVDLIESKMPHVKS